MRTLKLSHEQIELLLQCLGIAEQQFIETHQQINNTLIKVRNNTAYKEQQEIAKYYHFKACNIADLNTDIKNSKFDI